MGAALKFIIDGDSSAFEANMKRTERVIQQAAQNAFVYQQKYSNASSLTMDAEASRRAGVEEASRNIKARALRRARSEERAARLADEIGAGSIPENMRGGRGARGNGYAGPSGARGMGGAASAMFVSVGRDTAASLASGASPITVFLQQAPQVAQAFTMMGSKIGAFLLPAGLAVAGLAGLGYAVAKAAQGLGALGVEGGGEQLGKVRDEIRKTLRARVEALRLEREEAEKILKARREAAAAGYGGRLDSVGKARMEGRVLEAKNPEDARKIRQDYLKDQMDVAKMDYDNKKKDAYNRADPLAQKAADDAELAYVSARNALLQFNKEGTGSNGGNAMQLTDRQRIGAGVNSPGLQVANRQLETQKKIAENTRATLDYLKQGRTSSGGAVYFD